MIPASLYHPLFVWSLFALCLFYVFKIYGYNNNSLLSNQHNYQNAVIFGILVILFLGLRPISGIYFGDTINYADGFVVKQINPDLELYNLLHYDEKKDILFSLLMIFFSRFTDVTVFFLFIEFIYVGGNLWACKRLFPNNPWAAFLVVLSSFSFYSYGVNGIRNGAALALVLIAITFLEKPKVNRLFAFLLMIIAYFLHGSTALPSIMLILSFFIIKDFKWALFFWISSIFISLLAGNSISNVFEGLGFDDRLDGYIAGSQDEETMAGFSKKGFRWDFLLYSCVPIIIGYFVIIKRGIRNKIYELLLNTYTLSNAFWVMIIRASFSNRFAYLSWFLYPFVLAYPFLRMNVWQNQSHRAAIMILGNICFTIIMS